MMLAAKPQAIVSALLITLASWVQACGQGRSNDHFTVSVGSEPIPTYDSVRGNPIRLTQALGLSSSGSQGGATRAPTATGASSTASSANLAGNTAPNMIGDFFDGGAQTITFTETMSSSFFADGMLVSTTPVFAFEEDGMGSVFDDVLTASGTGRDVSGDGFDDTYDIEEPLPPNEVLTSPGSEFTFDGGTATYTNSTASTTAADGNPVSDAIGPWHIDYSFSQTRTIRIPAAGGGVAVRRFKIAENNNPMPRDRFFFNYSFFNDVQSSFGDVSRYTLGFEKTYLRGNASFELRVPFAATLDSVQVDQTAMRNFEFGNALMTYKLLLWRDQRFAWSTGTGISIPTASGSQYFLQDGREILNISNQSVHFLPFMGFAFNSSGRFFHESFVQFDIDPYGNPVYADIAGLGNSGPLGRPRIGVINDASVLFVDAAFGYWLVNSPCGRGLTGMAPVVEFHYATSVNDTDVVEGNGLTVADTTRRFDVLNLTLGNHMRFGQRIEVAAGMTLPLRTGNDEPFDYEALVQVNFLR